MSSDDRRERLIRAGRWLRHQRIQRGFATQVELAHRLGVDKAAVSNYETGKNAVDDDKARQIAEAFGMNEIEVRRGLGLWVPPEAPRSPMDKAEAGLDKNERLAAEIRELAARERRAVEAFIAELTKDPAETRETEDENHR